MLEDTEQLHLLRRSKVRLRFRNAVEIHSDQYYRVTNGSPSDFEQQARSRIQHLYRERQPPMSRVDILVDVHSESDQFIEVILGPAHVGVENL